MEGAYRCSFSVGRDFGTVRFPFESKGSVVLNRAMTDFSIFIDDMEACVVSSRLLHMHIAHSAYPDSPLGPDAFREYESLLVQDYEELLKRCKAKSEQSGESKVMENLTSEDEGWSQLTFGDEVSPLEVESLFYLQRDQLLKHILSTPHENSLSPGLPPLSTGSPPDSEDVLPGATLTAQFLYHLAAKMDLKMEIYSLGDLSKTVGKLLTDMSSLYDVGRRKRSAGLLLIDRTLDLLTPCSHGDSLIERIFSALPRRELTTSSAHMKGSQTQRKLGPVHLQRAPLDVQIPLTKFLCEEDSTTENFRLVDSIEAFLHGWNSSDFAFQTVELLNLSTKLHGEKSFHSESKLLNGSFVSAESFRGTPYLEAILDRRTKDGAILIRKWLQETLRRENVNANVKIRPGFATKTELQPLIRALARIQSSFMRNKGIIQLAAATLYALDELHCTKWDGFISAEKMLNVSAGDTSQSLAAQISDLINKSSLVGSHGKKNWANGAFTGTAFFPRCFAPHSLWIYIGGREFPNIWFLSGLTEELEANFRKMKSEEAKEESPRQLQSDDFDDDQWGTWGDEDADKNIKKEEAYGDMQLKLELRDRVDNLFKFLHKLSSTKRRNLPFREGTLGMESSFNDDPCSSKGLIYKLLTRVLGKHDIPGLEYHSSTVGRIFKSGFGRFGLGQAKPSLADQNVLLVFVIGGINGVEVGFS
ncbi:hypothetical protein Acr_20g0011130 [Actinidia rufa]|uniref:Sec1/munc18-like (SM) proteins superfamily n=1 Tax=Actinidia rufa TaxID=165716 RepID=A0A7J0GEW3_9ERIC|nr:hypothetical protein Acr_20g0011130 [Actinidia rufa]